MCVSKSVRFPFPVSMKRNSRFSVIPYLLTDYGSFANPFPFFSSFSLCSTQISKTYPKHLSSILYNLISFFSERICDFTKLNFQKSLPDKAGIIFPYPQCVVLKPKVQFCYCVFQKSYLQSEMLETPTLSANFIIHKIQTHKYDFASQLRFDNTEFATIRPGI